MARKLIAAALLAATLTLSAAALAADYVGASTTHKFHYQSCRWAKHIRADHRVEFNTRQEAINAGYVPCAVCGP